VKASSKLGNFQFDVFSLDKIFVHRELIARVMFAKCRWEKVFSKYLQSFLRRWIFRGLSDLQAWRCEYQREMPVYRNTGPL
jgi:hypothetical protein